MICRTFRIEVALTSLIISQWDRLFEEIARVMKPGAAFEVNKFNHLKKRMQVH